jgi:anti-sigma B factor antagonist
MHPTKLEMNVRNPSKYASVIDIRGEVTSLAEGSLMDAYQQATENRASSIILNFENLEYMNSGGIGLLVTLLIRAQRNDQRLMAYGLNEHYRQIFELTRLNEAIGIFGNETDAVAAGIQ